jgi:hypothetical protein
MKLCANVYKRHSLILHNFGQALFAKSCRPPIFIKLLLCFLRFSVTVLSISPPKRKPDLVITKVLLVLLRITGDFDQIRVCNLPILCSLTFIWFKNVNTTQLYSLSFVVPSDHLKNKSSLLWSLCFSHR